MRVCSDVVDRFLLHRHALEIGRQGFRLISIVAAGRIKAHEIREHGAVVVILNDPFL